MSADAPRRVGRYWLHHELASGGMGTVYLATSTGQAGFRRFVAVKRMHRHLARDPAFVEMFVDEARVASELRHPAVVPVIDVVDDQGELLLVMDYVEGLSLDRVLDAARECQEPLPCDVAVRVLLDALAGAHSAHEARDATGRALGIVHRDLSPHNLLVGADGATRVLDFGVAHAEGKIHQTRAGVVRGKASYMAPEQLAGHAVDARADVYSLGITLWEVLVGRRAYPRSSDAEIAVLALTTRLLAPHEARPEIPRALSDVVTRAVAQERDARWEDARAFSDALERALQPASPRDVARFLRSVASDALDEKARLVRSVATQSQSELDAAHASETRDTAGSTDRTTSSTDSASTDRDTSSTDSAVIRAVTTPRENSNRTRVAIVGALVLGALALSFVVARGGSSEVEKTEKEAPTTPAATSPSNPAARDATRDAEPPPAAPTANPSGVTSGASAATPAAVTTTEAPTTSETPTTQAPATKPSPSKTSPVKPTSPAAPSAPPAEKKPTSPATPSAPPNEKKPTTFDDLLGRH